MRANNLMLEHFARLAATVGGTRAAGVCLLRGRDMGGPDVAAYGLRPEQTDALMALDKTIADGGSLTIIPDLLENPYNSHAAVHGLRFLAHLKLVSAGGERIGFICVSDPSPRSGLTPAQSAGLEDLASMILTDRKREQRHRHLMHVANRALRVDRMLRLVSEAASCADALSSLLEELCRFHNAATGRIWQLVRTDQSLQEISRYDAREADCNPAPVPVRSISNSIVAGAIRRNEPHAIRLSQLSPAERWEQLVAPGIESQVCVPVSVQQQRFGILLAFTCEPPDLEMVMADVASLADTIRPALFRKVTEERIRFVALHDNLTQLANRLTFQEQLDKAITLARGNDQQFALLYLDLDGFKAVNDTRGHEIGDKLLIATAQRLRENLREGDLVARMGGDEFAIIQLSGAQPAAASALAHRLLTTIRQPFELAGRHSTIGTSIGIAIYPQDGEDADSLLRNADIALYRAKQAGRHTFRLFHPDMQAEPQRRLAFELELRQAVETGRFTLEYQPICDISTLHVTGFEALLRWTHPLRGRIPPEAFIPVAEASGLIIPLGLWALEAACAEAATWKRPAGVSVNLSPLQFRQPDLPEQIAAVLSRTGLAATRLELEITEGVLLEDSDLVLQTTKRLHEQGIRIALDDFGTAYASLSYLRRFPFHCIKIDRSFTASICEDQSALAIVEAILSLADKLHLSVVAEGVETTCQLELLRNLGCRLVQGFLPGCPMSNEQAQLILDSPPLGALGRRDRGRD